MTKKVFVTGKVELKSTFSQLAEPVNKSEVRSRGPNNLGQLKSMKTVHLGKIEQEDLNKRWDGALKILETGKVPEAVKSAPGKVVDATVAQLKGQLTKAKKKIETLEQKLSEAKKTDEDS